MTSPLTLVLFTYVAIKYCQSTSELFLGLTRLEWAEASAYCQNHSGHLVSIHSSDEQFEAEALCGTVSHDYEDSAIADGYRGCWIGLHEPSNDGEWEWSDGSNTDYGFIELQNGGWSPNTGEYPWGANQPSSSNNLCIILKWRADFEWNDVQSYHHNYPMCSGQAPVDTSAPTDDQSTQPTDDPTKKPTGSPTAVPTTNPTTSEPTSSPITKEPTLSPTKNPTLNPTDDPTHVTSGPTFEPSSINPTGDPTHEPTINPTMNPTTDPTVDPTGDPTHSPSKIPTTTNPTGFLLDLSVSTPSLFSTPGNVSNIDIDSQTGTDNSGSDQSDGITITTLISVNGVLLIVVIGFVVHHIKRKKAVHSEEVAVNIVEEARTSQIEGRNRLHEDDEHVIEGREGRISRRGASLQEQNPVTSFETDREIARGDTLGNV